MASYLLDTNILVAMLKDEYGVSDQILSHGYENCYVPEISLAELYYGAFYSETPETHLPEVAFVATHFRLLPVDNVLSAYGEAKADLRRQGKLIDDFDILIGVTAIENKMIVVTDNVSHLGRLEGVLIENWIDRSIKRRK